MPQSGTPTTNSLRERAFQIAQATGEGSAPLPAAEHATAEVAHAGGGHEEVENPLAEYTPLYYSGIGLLVFAILTAFAVVTTRGLTVWRPSRGQTLIEQCVASMRWFCRAAIGEGGEKFAPLVGTIFAFVLVSNLMGALPTVFHKTHSGVTSWTPAPTSNLSMTIAIALVVFFVVQYVGIKENGLGGYLKHFAGPVPALAPLIFPIELVGAFVKPISLSIRLFGNIFGEESVVAVLVALGLSFLPKWLPIPLQLPMVAFGVFGAVVQAGVFTILTCAYIALAIGEHDHHGHHHEVDEFGAQEGAGHHVAYAIGNQAH